MIKAYKILYFNPYKWDEISDNLYLNKIKSLAFWMTLKCSLYHMVTKGI